MVLPTILIIALSTSSATADTIADGKALAKSKECFSCHGIAGNTERVYVRLIVPKISGQSKEYLVKALMDYRSGARSGTVMTEIMSVRTDEEIELLSIYYAAQKMY